MSGAGTVVVRYITPDGEAFASEQDAQGGHHAPKAYRDQQTGEPEGNARGAGAIYITPDGEEFHGVQDAEGQWFPPPEFHAVMDRITRQKADAGRATPPRKSNTPPNAKPSAPPGTKPSNAGAQLFEAVRKISGRQ